MNLQEFLAICDFAGFPFDIKPGTSAHIWVGRPGTLDQLRSFMHNVTVNRLSEFGIITGRRGSGKSHSLLHLKYMIEHVSETSSRPALCIYIDNPIGMGSKGTFVENYRYVLNTYLGKALTSSIFQSAMPELRKGSASASRSKVEKARRGDLAKRYYDIVGDSPVTIDLVEAIVRDDKNWWEWLSSAPRVSKVGRESVQPLNSHILCSKSLAAIIKLAIMPDRSREPTKFSSVFILVDQTEDLARLPGGAFQDQIVGWRTLIDGLDSRFGMLWAMEGSAEDVEASFTEAIRRRQTMDPSKMSLSPLTIPEAKQFLLEIMKAFRKEGSQVSEAYPFEIDALTRIVTETKNRTPSELLVKCRQIALYAADHDLIKKKGDKISPEQLSKYFGST